MVLVCIHLDSVCCQVLLNELLKAVVAFCFWNFRALAQPAYILCCVPFRFIKGVVPAVISGCFDFIQVSRDSSFFLEIKKKNPKNFQTMLYFCFSLFFFFEISKTHPNYAIFLIFFGHFQKVSEKIPNYAIFLDLFWKFPKKIRKISKLCYIFVFFLEFFKKIRNFSKLRYIFGFFFGNFQKKFQTMLHPRAHRNTFQQCCSELLASGRVGWTSAISCTRNRIAISKSYRSMVALKPTQLWVYGGVLN